MQLSRALIQDLELFTHLSDADLDTVLRDASARRILEGERVFQQGDATKEFYLLLNGRLKVVQTTAEGEQIIVRHVNPGDVFGIARAMRRAHFPASAIAVQESLVLAWPSRFWDTLLALSPAFAAATIQTVGERLQDAHSRIRELSTEEVEQRVARALLRLVEQSGQATEEGMQIGFPVTRQDIAEMTGTTLHTVSRLLSAWKDRGIVSSGRRRITVRSTEALHQVAHQRPRA